MPAKTKDQTRARFPTHIGKEWWVIELPHVKLDLHESEHTITLVRLMVEKGHRRKGHGSGAVRQLQQVAMLRKKNIRLTPADIDDTPRSEVVIFYKSVGFVWMNDNETMYWHA